MAETENTQEQDNESPNVSEESTDYSTQRTVELNQILMNPDKVYHYEDGRRKYIDFVDDDDFDFEKSGRFNTLTITGDVELTGKILQRQRTTVRSRRHGMLSIARITFASEDVIKNWSQDSEVTLIFN